MLKLRLLTGPVILTGCAALLALSPALHASPPEPVAAFLGEWSGEVTRGVAGEALARPVANARRYWDEGDIVRGEFIISGESSLRTVQVALVPRGSRFVRIVTPESGVPEYFVGSVVERGVAWTPLQGVRERFLERVSGTGPARKLELLISDGDGWRVADTLAPSTTSAFGGSLDGTTAAPVERLVLPADSELALLERLAEQVEVGVAARANSDRLARELAAAWRDTEEARARVKAAEADAAKARAELKSAGEIGTASELQGQIDGARRNLKEARDYAAELETNLEATTRRADAGAARVKTLETELAAQKVAAATAITQSTALEGQRQELQARLAEQEKKALGAETALAETGRARTAADESRIKAEADLATTRAALEKSAGEKTALEARIAQLTTTAGDAARMTAQLAEARRANEALAKDVETRQAAVLAAEVAAREAAQRETDARAETARTAQTIDDLRTQFAAMSTARDEAITRLNAIIDEVEKTRTGGAQLVADLGALKTQVDQRSTEVEALRQQLASASGSGAENAEARVRLEAELVTVKKQLEESSVKAAALDAAHEELQKTESARAQAAQALAALEKESEAMRTTTVQLQKELSDLRVTADERARDAAQAREQLAAAAGAGESTGREKSALEAELAVVKKQLQDASATAASLAAAQETLQKSETARVAAAAALVAAQKEVETARTATAQLEKDVEALRSGVAVKVSEIELLKGRLASQGAASDSGVPSSAALESELAGVKAELALAVRARDDAEAAGRLAAAAAQGQAGSAEKMSGELTQSRARINELETEATGSAARVATLERELTTVRAQSEERAAAGASDARIVDLEKRLADTYSRAEARQAEIDRLLQRVAQLEGTAPAGARVATESAELDQLIRSLAEAEAARRDLEARNAALLAQLRSAQGGTVATAPAAAAPVRAPTPAPVAARPTPASATTTAPAAPAPGRVAAPTRPTGADASVRVTPVGPRAPGSDPAVIQIVQRLSISGYRNSGAESVAVIDGQPCHAGQLVEVVRGVRFARIDAGAAVFTTPDGAEYRRVLQ